MNNELKGKTALVTGASRGIGKAIALALGRMGINVAVNYITNEAMAQDVCQQITSYGSKSICIQADVSVSKDVASMISTIEKEVGAIDILVNNAGIGYPCDSNAVTEQEWDNTLECNLKSIFLVTQAAMPSMRTKKWGRIINLSSTAAHIGGIIGPHYAASKAGIIGLTHYYAAALAKEGITVNSIAPALIETEMITSNPKASPRLIPVGRFGNLEEIANVATMLVCNGYLTGQTINVNGGLYMS